MRKFSNLQSTPWPTDPVSAARTLQIIVGALIMGVVTFAIVAIVIVNSGPVPKQVVDIGTPLAMIAIAQTVLILGAWVFVPTILDKTARALFESEDWHDLEEEERTKQLIARYMTRTIIANALLEGVAFLPLICVIIEKQFWFAGIAGLSVLMMISGFPSLSRFETWSRHQRQLTEHDL